MKKSMNSQKIDLIIEEMKEELGDNLVSIYGIGSYFDTSLPSDWAKDDMDIIVIVKSLAKIPKRDWTDVRYAEKKIKEVNVWVGYNTIEGYQSKDAFGKFSFSNYEWSLLDVKITENSNLIYGLDIRQFLPELSNLEFDYDDILSRSLYHLEKSLKISAKKGDNKEAVQEFTKGIFKFGFYISILFDKKFRFTSFRKISNCVERIIKNNNIDRKIKEFLKFSILFRRKGQIINDFYRTREEFITYIFTLLSEGKLHKELSFKEIIVYLNNSFSGMPLLIEEIRKISKKVKI